MHEQPGDRDCDKPAIGGNHFGPVVIYMAAVEDAQAADGSDPFFKVEEYGYTSADGLWGTDVLNNQCGRFEFTACLSAERPCLCVHDSSNMVSI